MDQTTTIIIAVVAALSLALQGTHKALDLLKKKRSRANGVSHPDMPRKFADEWDQVHAWTRELHALHDRRDDDGVPVWYVSSRLVRTLETIAGAITTQTEILRSQQADLSAIRERSGR